MKKRLNNSVQFFKRNKRSIIVIELIILSALIYRAYSFTHKQQHLIDRTSGILPYGTPITLSEGNERQTKTASVELSVAQ